MLSEKGAKIMAITSNGGGVIRVMDVNSDRPIGGSENAAKSKFEGEKGRAKSSAM